MKLRPQIITPEPILPIYESVLRVDPATIENLETILVSLGRDPDKASAGWRSEDPLVVAILFAALGYPVFPGNLKKEPLNARGCNGATCNLTSILYWARAKPFRSWCVKTGRYHDVGGPPGLWIFDKDDAAGYARWAELVAELGPPPETWTLMSGRDGGGEHVYYAPAPGGPDMKTVSKALIAGKRGKIDQKGRGGYGVTAGSYHKSGRRYHWAPGRSPDEIPLATLSAEWAAAMDKADEPAAPRDRSSHSQSNKAPHQQIPNDGSAVIGDGPGRGGFHSAIYKSACRMIYAAGADIDAQILLKLLKAQVLAAPVSPDRDPASVARYSSDAYLLEQIENARRWVMKEQGLK